MSGDRTALVFEGQGGDAAGIPAALDRDCPVCGEVLDEADAALGFPLSKVVFEGTPDELRQTAVAQPVLVTIGVAHARHLLSLGVLPAYLAGHSIGQYAALVIADAVDFADAVRLAARRGELMQAAVPDGVGAMVAVSGIELSEVLDACQEPRHLGVVGVACDNAPGRTVVSGTSAAVEAVVTACQDEGAVTVELPVSAPFHCELLTDAKNAFATALGDVTFRTPAISVVDNVTARPLRAGDDIPSLLSEHIVARVRFRESLELVAASGVVGEIVTCGPGHSLLKMIGKTAPGVRAVSFDRYMQERAPSSGGGH
ncbi:ACP S-malonyltransferase [Actinomadura sp. K4S16]|uniref:ACP S-malonyltransferase n=1 Tax=Actinomadura sp. K4S16 TaxID=1316147 RepID=UPI0011F099EE|nr:ACP S-malonyltransferase [Actinomadura sp. K4S16]